MRDMEKARVRLEAILPNYFHEFDASPVVADLKKQSKDQKDPFPYLSRFHSFINDKNFHARDIPGRKELSLSTRLEIHSTEAAVLHRMRAHNELLNAYRWHQISARRQDASLRALQSPDPSLAQDYAIIQVDFKENVKYPLSGFLRK